MGPLVLVNPPYLYQWLPQDSEGASNAKTLLMWWINALHSWHPVEIAAKHEGPVNLLPFEHRVDVHATLVRLHRQWVANTLSVAPFTETAICATAPLGVQPVRVRWNRVVLNNRGRNDRQHRGKEVALGRVGRRARPRRPDCRSIPACRRPEFGLVDRAQAKLEVTVTS